MCVFVSGINFISVLIQLNQCYQKEHQSKTQKTTKTLLHTNANYFYELFCSHNIS